MKKVKFILPVVAIMFAVAGVFATGNSTAALTNVDVTLGHLVPSPNQNCIKDGYCDDTIGTNVCKTASGVTFKIRTAGGTCLNDMTNVGTFVYQP